MTACSTLVTQDGVAYPESAQFKDGRFRNPIPRPPIHFWDNPKLVWTFFFDKPVGTVPDRSLPVHELTRTE